MGCESLSGSKERPTRRAVLNRGGEPVVSTINEAVSLRLADADAAAVATIVASTFSAHYPSGTD